MINNFETNRKLVKNFTFASDQIIIFLNRIEIIKFLLFLLKVKFLSYEIDTNFLRKSFNQKNKK